jgi:hypothetical protein
MAHTVGWTCSGLSVGFTTATLELRDAVELQEEQGLCRSYSRSVKAWACHSGRLALVGRIRRTDALSLPCLLYVLSGAARSVLFWSGPQPFHHAAADTGLLIVETLHCLKGALSM